MNDETWFIPMYPDPKAPVDRTGAGDAFSSTFTSALALGKDISEALTWGPINSMSVVQYIGAQKGLLTLEGIQKYLASAPENYKPQKI
jgi:sugar/nucleoside kinase (ribokinase family)